MCRAASMAAAAAAVLAFARLGRPCALVRRRARTCSSLPPPAALRLRRAAAAGRRRGVATLCQVAADVSKGESLHGTGVDAVDASDVAEEPHVPVLLRQVLSYFEGRQLRVLLDGTLGAAGHASALINAHPEMHTFIGLDVDPVAHELATRKLEAAAAGRQLSVHLVRTNFRHLKQTLAKLPPSVAANGVDGILLDLGMSSMQVNTADRGFSFSKDGPVDMRMDPTAALSAADIVNTWPESDLGELIRDYGEDRQWRRLARKLIEARIEVPITTTAQLAAALGPLFYPKSKGKRGSKPIHPATRVFQALRIVVNDELGAIRQVLPHAIECLAPGGRLGVISFHSLEDRIVKRAFRLAAGMHSNEEHSDFNLHSLYGLPATMKPPAEAVVKILTKRPLVADDDEIAANPRSRSAKLRVVEKL